MDEDIFKDMIDYGDEADSSVQKEEKPVPETAIEEDFDYEDDYTAESVTHTDREDYEADDSAEDYFYDDADDEENPETASFGEYTEDMDIEADDYEFDHYEEMLHDDRLVVPMIKPLLKYLIPLFALLALIIFVMTSNIPTVRSYRENFISNANQLLYNIGIDFSGNETVTSVVVVDEEIGLEYIRNPNGHDEEIQYRTEIASDIKLTFDGASNSKFVRYKDGVICAKTNYICFINKDGEKEWEKNVSIIDPILKSEGKYFMLAQKGGTKFAMYKEDKALYENSSENNILGANVSANGDVVLITEKPGYKGTVAVYNKRGDKAFAWSSGSSSIISADISAKSRRVAVALLNTDSTVRSGVYLFNIKKPDSYAQQVFENSIIYNVDFKNDYLEVFADNSLMGMRSSGKMPYKIDFGEVELASSCVDENGDKLMLFTGTNVPIMNIYSRDGKLKNTISSRKIPDFAYVYDENVIYNVDREIFLSKLNAKIPYKYTAAMDIQGIVPIDSKSFMVIYSNSVSVVKMKGVLW